MSGQSPYMSATPYGYPTNYPQRDNRYPTNSNVDTAMGLNRRLSLRTSYHNPFANPERAGLAPYLLPLPPMPMGPHADEHPKRTRYQMTLPISVDVKKEQPLYQPQTEAISPILDEPKGDSNLRDSTIIRNSISKLESDIEITMKKLHGAKLNQNEIKNRADRSAAVDDDVDDRTDSFPHNGSQTLIEKILHDNRKKAEDSQKLLNQLNNNMDLTIPLYQEPNDLQSIEKIRIQYMNVMKNRLVNLFKKSRDRYMQRTAIESEKYDQIYTQWQKSIEKDEKSILAKDTSTYRETFEKTFPEIRKAREDKERKQSIQNSTDTSPDQQAQPTTAPTNPIAIEQEPDNDVEYEKMRKSSIVPPIMFDRWQRKHQYFNQNNLMPTDMVEGFYKQHSKLPFWSAEEKQIFIEKFTQSPKNFGYISSFLENKTTEQCVQFYYMTKKAENYKNLLRKQSQTNRRRAKLNAGSTTTTTVTSSTTIETTLVTKVTSSNTIVSSTLGQISLRQDGERAIDRMDNDPDRRESNSGDTAEGKTFKRNRCQLLSCSTDRGGKKKYRKFRLQAFPNEWNDLPKEHREEIRRSLQIPSNVQRCCKGCYDKIADHVQQRQNLPDDDDESNPKAKDRDEQWSDTDIQAFTEALEKFNHDWTQIAEYLHRSEESCRAFYLKSKQKIRSPTHDHPNDEDTGSEIGQMKAINGDTNVNINNDDSGDSNPGMVIDENDEQSSIVDEKPFKPIPMRTNLTTINTLVEQEITKTLHETEKRIAHPIRNVSPERTVPSNRNTPNSNVPPPPPPPPPPPLVASNKSHPQYSPHPSQQYPASKGSIMRGTPIASSTPTNKPMSMDMSATHPHSHHYPNPRNEYAHLKSPKILDRNLEQQQHLLQQQQHQQHAAFIRQYNHQQQQQQQQHKNSTNKNELPSTDTFETLRADFVTSKHLPASNSPNHDRPHRSPPRSSPSMNQQLLPPPAVITQMSSNPSIPSSHHSQQQAALLTAQQILASQGVYPQDLIASGLFPYASYHGSLPTAPSPFLLDPRFMHEYASSAVANSEQFKAEHHKGPMRFNRQHLHHHPAIPHHSPPDPSYPNPTSKRPSYDLGYPSNDYPASIWRAQNPLNHPHQMKHSGGNNESSLSKLSEISQRSSGQMNERNSRSPDDFHHHVNTTRGAVESPSAHFQRVEAHNHHKSSYDKSNPNIHFSDHSTDTNPMNYLRQPTGFHKSQGSHHSPHRHHPHHPNATNRPLVPPMSNSQMSSHPSAYLLPGQHRSTVDNNTSRSTQPPTHYPSQSKLLSHSHHPPMKSNQEQISIQAFLNRSVQDFVGSSNTDNRTSTVDSHELSSNSLIRTQPVYNSDQPILLDGDEDSNPADSSDMLNKSNTDSDMPERGRHGSIKRILTDQPLAKQKYVEINQKVQSSITGSSKVHSDTDSTALERSNSLSGRTRSRGSITMRMLMGASDIYADGKVQSNTPTAADQQQSSKRQTLEKSEKLDYLIRDAIDRECPSLIKRDDPNTFSNSPSKRFRTSPKDDEQHQSSLIIPSNQESTNEIRDPFALQIHPQKNRSTPLEQDPSNSTDAHEHSPKLRLARKYNQSLSPISDVQHDSSNGKSPPASHSSPTPPPLATSPNISSAFNSAHSLKKRLISEYELEQQRNSPTVSSVDEPSTNPPLDNSKSENEDISKSETVDDETTAQSPDKSV